VCARSCNATQYAVDGWSGICNEEDRPVRDDERKDYDTWLLRQLGYIHSQQYYGFRFK